MMIGGTITFDEAVRVLASDSGYSIHDVGAFVHHAISGNGVTILGSDGNSFTWSSVPGRKMPGNTVINSDFDVFSVGNGWADFEDSRNFSASHRTTSARDGRSSVNQYGLDESWLYDRQTLARAVERLGLRIDALLREPSEAPASIQTKAAQEQRELANIIMLSIVSVAGFTRITEAKMTKQIRDKAMQMKKAVSGNAIREAWKALDPKYKFTGAPATPGNKEKGGHSGQ